MINIKKLSVILFGVLSLVLLNSCSSEDKDEDEDEDIPTSEVILPSDANALSSVLVIPAAQTVKSSTLPASSDASVAPVASNIDTNISYSSGSQIIIPSDVATTTQSNIKGVYVQVKGASTYFDIPINSNTTDALISLPVNIPSIVGAGNFILILKFYDSSGNISSVTEVAITVTNPSSCGVITESGGEGLTSTVFKVPNKAGAIKISYDTYTVPDKIDVFQGGVWIGGTGSTTDRSTLRKALSCNVATTDLGYVGQKSEFVFNYNPALGENIEVVVSGCENGGTGWEYTFSCPEDIVINPGTGKGEFTLDNVTYSGDCLANQVTSCDSDNDDTTVDVYLTDPFNGGIVIYNMPPQSSGNFPFVQFTESSNCELYLLPNMSSSVIVPYSGTTGTVTKTGSNSFTFTQTFTDINGIPHTISGSGSYY